MTTKKTVKKAPKKKFYVLGEDGYDNIASFSTRIQAEAYIAKSAQQTGWDMTDVTGWEIVEVLATVKSVKTTKVEVFYE